MDFRSIQSFVSSPGSDGLRYSPSPPVESPANTYVNMDDLKYKVMIKYTILSSVALFHKPSQ